MYKNRVELIGNLGADPEFIQTQNGGTLARLSVATSENWRDRTTGERRTATEWHRVTVFSEGLVSLAQKYLRKGMRVMVEGQLRTRKWEKDGTTHYSTEIVLQGYNAVLTMMDPKRDDGYGAQMEEQASRYGADPAPHAPAGDERRGPLPDDEMIPF